MKRLKKIPLPKKQQIPLIIVVVAFLVTTIGLLVSVTQKTTPAGVGNLYLSERSLSAQEKQDVTYTVRITPGTTIDTVTATLTYDKDKLTFKSADYKNSPFSVQIPALKHDGSVTIQAAQFNGAITGDSLFARVTFTATRSGNHEVKLSAGNAAHAGTATNPALNGVTQYAEETRSSTAPAANPVIRSSQYILQTAGASPEAALRGAPWLIGVIISLLAAIPVTLVYLKQRKSGKAKSSSKQSADIVHSDHKDTRS